MSMVDVSDVYDWNYGNSQTLDVVESFMKELAIHVRASLKYLHGTEDRKRSLYDARFIGAVVRSVKQVCPALKWGDWLHESGLQIDSRADDFELVHSNWSDEDFHGASNYSEVEREIKRRQHGEQNKEWASLAPLQSLAVAVQEYYRDSASGSGFLLRDASKVQHSLLEVESRHHKMDLNPCEWLTKNVPFNVPQTQVLKLGGSEKDLENFLADKLRKDKRRVETQIPCEMGTIDLVIDNVIVELERYVDRAHLFHSVGQALLYRASRDPSCHAFLIALRVSDKARSLFPLVRSQGVHIYEWSDQAYKALCYYSDEGVTMDDKATSNSVLVHVDPD